MRIGLIKWYQRQDYGTVSYMFTFIRGMYIQNLLLNLFNCRTKLKLY
jgi:hypothetical protein